MKNAIIDRKLLIETLIPELAASMDEEHRTREFSRVASIVCEALNGGSFQHMESTIEQLHNSAFSIAEVKARADMILLLAQATALSKKRASALGVTQELKAAALEKHLQNEAFNSRTNLRFERGTHNRYVKSVLVRARHKMFSWLGLLNDHYDDIMDSVSLGSGSVYSKASRCLFSKLSSEQTIAFNTLPLLDAFISSSPGLVKAWAEAEIKLDVITGNKLSYVPKDVKKCRLIAVEPSINVMLQLGIGKKLTEICYRVGQDIRNQERNRVRALEGSIDGSNATIDLSDASSLISIGLVKYLVPADWYLLLDAARSQSNTTTGTWASFSSQGNAFTFPLETLIFTAIVDSAHEIACERYGIAARHEDVSVYGDDIICPVHSAKLVIDALHGCGLKVNVQKSFFDQTSPCFRESCGLDAYGGYNVRPIYYKMDATSPSDVAKLHNGLLLRYSCRIRNTIEWLRGLVPQRLSGPWALYSSDEWSPRNTLTIPTYQWFIEDLPLSVKWGKTADTTKVSWRYYHVSAKKLTEPVIHPSLLLQIIMHGGVGWDDSPFLRKSTRTVNTVLSAVVLSEDHLLGVK